MSIREVFRRNAASSFVSASFLVALVVAVGWSSGVLSPGSGSLVAQDDEVLIQDFPRFLTLVDNKYLPASPGKKQAIRLKFNLTTAVPKGAKIKFELIHQGLPIDQLSSVFELKATKRVGIWHEWELKKKLGPDDYILQVNLDADAQEKAVRDRMYRNKKAFPKVHNPFMYQFFEEGKAIEIGTPEERKAQDELACSLYEEGIDDLLNNYKEFADELKSAREKKKFHKGEEPDQASYAKFIRSWRIKQGGAQRKILQEFPEKYSTILARSRTAHANLIELSKMVSKRAYTLQKEVEAELGFKHENPAP